MILWIISLQQAEGINTFNTGEEAGAQAGQAPCLHSMQIQVSDAYLSLCNHTLSPPPHRASNQILDFESLEAETTTQSFV